MEVDSTGHAVCKLCRQPVDKLCEDVHELDEIAEVLGVDFEIPAADQKGICELCFKMIKKFKVFKVNLVKTEEQLFPYLNSDNTDINLKEVFGIKTECPDDTEVCRLCKKVLEKETMQPITKVLEENNLRDVVEKHFPEVDVSLADSLICEMCVQCLEDFKNFAINIDYLRNPKDLDVRSEITDEIKSEMDEIKSEIDEIKSEVGDEDVEIKNELDSDSDSSDVMETESDNVADNIPDTDSNIKIEESEMVDDEAKREPETVRKNQYEAHLKYICQICGYATSRKFDLKHHSRIHMDSSEVYNCSNCSFFTRYKTSLKRHKVTHQDISELNMFACEFCDFKTKHRMSLKTHVLALHRRMYRCKICSYRTVYKSNMKVHVVAHRTPVLYQCQFCTYKSILKCNVTKHFNSVHNKYIYSCFICDFKSTSKERYDDHLLIHKNPLEIGRFNYEFYKWCLDTCLKGNEEK